MAIAARFGSAFLAALVLVAGCDGSSDAPPPANAPAVDRDADDDAPTSPALARGPDSAEAEVMAALADATGLRVLRLEPAGAGVDCRMGNCIEGNAILGGMLLRDFPSSAQARTVLREWL